MLASPGFHCYRPRTALEDAEIGGFLGQHYRFKLETAPLRVMIGCEWLDCRAAFRASSWPVGYRPIYGGPFTELGFWGLLRNPENHAKSRFVTRATFTEDYSRRT